MMHERERWQLILTRLRDRGIVRVADLVGVTGASVATLRRDLAKLEDSGQLRRVHGGAESVASGQTPLTAPSFDASQTLNADLKQAVAQGAANLCHDGDSIILESDCRVGDMTATSRTVVTGDFDSAYTMKSDVQLGGSNATRSLQAAMPQGPTSQSTTIQAKRTGDCDANLKPGDIDLGEGRTMNVRDMPDPQPMQ